VLQKIGVKYSILLSHAAIALRVLLLIAVPEGDAIWSVTAIELLHGLSFALSWMAAVQWSDLIAPANRTTTSQGLLGAAMSVGGALGNVVGGIMFSRYSATTMWLTIAAVNLTIGLIYCLVPMRDLEGRRVKKIALEKTEMLAL
jgi:predicted MFS family arabinose efflux permease